MRFRFIGNDPDFWITQTPEIKENLFQVIRELLVNMKKHSHATQVIVRFLRTDNNYQMDYRDNDVGIDESFVAKNGFANIKSRLEIIGANMAFDNTHQGLRISILWDKRS